MSGDIAVRSVPVTDRHLLAETGPLVDVLADDHDAFVAVRDVAAAAAAVGFTETALGLYDRCLRLSLSAAERQQTYAELTVACHGAATAAVDPAQRSRHLHDGLYAATAALDPEGPQDLAAMCVALAHRAVLLAEIGHHESALVDARRARGLAIDLGMRREQTIAAIGEVVARWHSSLDTTVLLLIGEIHLLAADEDLDELLQPVTRIEVDALWSMDRQGEARAVLQRSNERLHDRLHRRREDRWQALGDALEGLRMIAELTADALTGLPNRRVLDRLLAEALAGDSPACVVAIDVDGFAYVNETYGPASADAVLQELAALLERVCRRHDSVSRVGADEFVLVLSDASPADARVVLERIRQLIAARSWQALPDAVHLTVSMGACVGSVGDSAEVLQVVAADALREAKAGGGDRVSFR